MKKIIFLIFIFMCVGFVNAEDDILQMEKEVAPIKFKNMWTHLNRQIYTFDDYFLIVDEENNSWYYTTYDKEWNQIAYVEDLYEHYYYDMLTTKNGLYVFTAHSEDLTQYGTMEVKKYNKNFEFSSLNIQNILGCSEYDYCRGTLLDYYVTSSDEIHFLIYENYYNNKECFSEEDCDWWNVYEVCDVYDVLGTVEDESEGCREVFEGWKEPDYFHKYREIIINNSFNDYSIMEIKEDTFKEKFPNYYYRNNASEGEIIRDVYISGENILVSSNNLTLYSKGERMVEIIDNDYSGFLKAKIYNELIIALAYKKNYDNSENPYSIYETDVLFFDLEGNLIGTYENNLYSYDFILEDYKLILSNVYVDGICTIKQGVYYTYNSNCDATLLNEIYKVDEIVLAKSITKDVEIENPDTSLSIKNGILLCFISFLFVIIFRLKKDKFKRI